MNFRALTIGRLHFSEAFVLIIRKDSFADWISLLKLCQPQSTVYPFFFRTALMPCIINCFALSAAERGSAGIPSRG